MLDQFGGLGKVFSVVMDSYDYSNALNKVLPKIADAQRAKGGMMVLRPDSGDPISVVLEGLKAADKIFGSDVNAKGFKVLRNINVIQGDGININSIKQILDKVLAEGYSAQNVTYGMGGGLLQKVNRDTMSFATKLSYIQYADGTERDVMKKPKTDSDKISLPGILAVKAVNGIPTVFPAEMVKPEENLLKVVYNHGPVEGAFKDNFDTIRKRIDDQWNTIPASYDPVSAELRAKIKNWIQEFEKRFDQLYR
jgi:nicotinamide phosphoribosyltransferase